MSQTKITFRIQHGRIQHGRIDMVELTWSDGVEVLL